MNKPFCKPNHRLLVIDDNPAIHADFRKILLPKTEVAADLAAAEAAIFGESDVATERAAFEIDSAHQGKEGLALVQKSLNENRPYALAFVDVRMPPGWDGVETIEHIWKICPELQVVICTAYSDYSWDEMTKRLGHSDNLVVLKKPFDNVEVLQLAHALAKKWLLNRQANLQLADLEDMVFKRTCDLSAEIEHRAQVEASLRTTEERFAKAFHANPVAMALQSAADQKIVDVNDAFLIVSGYSRNELIHKSPSELGLWEAPEKVRNWLAELHAHQSVHEREARLVSKIKEAREVLVSLENISLRNEPHLLLLAQDITERLLLEQQLRQAQKMQAIGQLAAGIAHDFNNILTVIQGHAGVLDLMLGPVGVHRQCTEPICKAATRASNLIRQLLMFSRKQVMQFHPLNLNEVAVNMSSMLQRTVGETIVMEVQPTNDLPAVEADSGMIEQVILNLAVNARDAMPDGGRITIASSMREINRAATFEDPEIRQGRFVCLQFDDTGCGMDAAVLARLFEPFFTTKPVGKGTGLGLATVYGIIKQHRGWIEVESAVGRGTSFRIFLPASSQCVCKTEPEDDEPVLQCGNETVLVAEDEAPLREMVSEFLKSQGYNVLAAASGPEAIRLWDQTEGDIHLLLTDMVMPGGMTGGELADRLRACDPNLKVIYSSGYSPGLAGKELSICQGANFLPKPYTIAKLAHYVRQSLDNECEKFNANSTDINAESQAN